MRFAYLKPRTLGQHGGCRGGIGYNKMYSEMGEEYELEIGNNANASVKMVALLAHYDEVMALLENNHAGPLGTLVLASIERETVRLEEAYEERARAMNP